MVKSASPTEPGYSLPPTILPVSDRLMASFAKVVEISSEFSKEVGDVVRGDPAAMAGIVHSFAQLTSQVFRRWNLEILYLLSVENQMRFSRIKEIVPGISGRSLSLKLDEMEQLGLLVRVVSNDKPPQVMYSLSDSGRRLTRLSFPMVLQLSMDQGLRERLQASASTEPMDET